ncbi:transposase [Streptomyces somaliensis]|uniref:transposase n=1 Tax=Streptomyces somaliensis TaxID=78355 RepID=UPI0035A04AF9
MRPRTRAGSGGPSGTTPDPGGHRASHRTPCGARRRLRSRAGRPAHGVLHQVRTGARWRDLPERFRPGKTVDERHRLWPAEGTWERLHRQVQAEIDASGRSTGTFRSTSLPRGRISVPPALALNCRRHPPQRGSR